VELIRFVKLHPTFAQFGNVHVIAKSNLVTYKGPTMVASTLHAAAILLKESKDWDWFINLSGSDYPLVTQDGQSLSVQTLCFMLFPEAILTN
jgi:protein xylosyltransferase